MSGLSNIHVRAKAAAAGMTVSEYLQAQRPAQIPLEELRARLASYAEFVPSISLVEIIRAERDRDLR